MKESCYVYFFIKRKNRIFVGIIAVSFPDEKSIAFPVSNLAF